MRETKRELFVLFYSCFFYTKQRLEHTLLAMKNKKQKNSGALGRFLLLSKKATAKSKAKKQSKKQKALKRQR